MKKVCVIGHPIGHSRSPLIHNYWLKQYGIDGHYETQDVLPEQLPDFLSKLLENGYVGCNVTLPHKEAAIPLVARIDPIIAKTGSLNTIFVENGKLCATSTDGEGFYQNLLSQVPDFQLKGKTVAILGAGGSARAVIERVLRAGATEVKAFNRTKSRTDELATIFGTSLTPKEWNRFATESEECDLLVNTTSLGMVGQPPLELDLSSLQSHAVVADLVYVPLQTAFLKQAAGLGMRTVPGLGMLLHQAVIGFEKWFGVKPAVTPQLHRLIGRDIDPSYR